MKEEREKEAEKACFCVFGRVRRVRRVWRGRDWASASTGGAAASPTSVVAPSTGGQRYLCKDCGGKGICRCRHERRRSVCKECGGGSGAASTVGAAASARKAVGVAFASTGGGAMIAGSAAAAALRARATPYGLQRMRRRQPRAAGCEHGRQHSVCKECGGNGICEHGRVRSACKECGGGRSAGTAWVVWCAAGLV